MEQASAPGVERADEYLVIGYDGRRWRVVETLGSDHSFASAAATVNADGSYLRMLVANTRTGGLAEFIRTRPRWQRIDRL